MERTMDVQLILASGSPRRRELLALFGHPFAVHPADIDETMDPGKKPYDEVARLSREKALAVPREEGNAVIAADTVVVCDDRILGKPRSAEEAKKMLGLLSGRTHQVMTGCTVLYRDRAETFTEVTQVHFRPLSQGEIDSYVATREPMDKAGAYGIQAAGALLVQGLTGDYFNVMGLPIAALARTLREMGVTEALSEN